VVVGDPPLKIEPQVHVRLEGREDLPNADGVLTPTAALKLLTMMTILVRITNRLPSSTLSS